MLINGLFFLVAALLLLAAQQCEAALGLFNAAWLREAAQSSSGGGVPCIACTISVGLLEQLAVLHNKTVDSILDHVCDLFPAGAKATCEFYVAQYGAAIVKLLASGLTADQACHGLTLCTNPTCQLWPANNKKRRAAPPPVLQNLAKANGVNPWQWIEDLLKQVIDHKPEIDLDGDGFSIIPVLRGSDWRGKDCDDLHAQTHPGAKTPVTESGDRDCNGIWGVNPATGNTWEHELCDGVPHLGVVAIGDSAGAHFEIPPAWMNASEMGPSTYRDLLERAALEFDLPQFGGYTGHLNLSYMPTDSIYKFMLQQNRCVHRDFQNLCVNGMRSGAVVPLIETMARSNVTDHPVLVFFELIGNDVCSGHHDFSHMTTVAEFRTNIMAALTALDQKLPPGSKVVTVSLADGEVLYQWLHNRTHPIGVTYERVYDMLNCLELSPCWGWMNNNATVRNITQQRADDLSAVYGEIAANHTFKNFELVAMPFPLKQIEAEAAKLGLANWQLIEPIDGFHPGPWANTLASRWQWSTLLKLFPQFTGAPNPNNVKIMQMFGDQGGY